MFLYERFLGELCGGKGGTKHREMQLQLQKKIQQKNEVKERKRKMQVNVYFFNCLVLGLYRLIKV